MGHYTTLKFSATVKKGEVFETLNAIINLNEEVPVSHSFFSCPRWKDLFFGKNCEDFPDPSFNKHGHLKIHSEFKGHENDLYKFIDWIAPSILTSKCKYKVEGGDEHWIDITFDDKSLEFNKLLMKDVL